MDSDKSVHPHTHPGQGLKGDGIATAAPFKRQNGPKSFCQALPGAVGKARIRHPPGARPHDCPAPLANAPSLGAQKKAQELAERNL